MSWTTLRLLGLRGLAADWPSTLAVAAIVAVTAGVVAAAPPALDRWQEAGLRHEAESAPPRERDIEVVQAARLDPEALSASGNEHLGGLPRALSGLVRLGGLVADTPRYEIVPLPGRPRPEGTSRFVTLRVQEGVEEHIRLAAGRLPAVADDAVRLPAEWLEEDAPVLEVVLSSATAAALSVELRETLVIAPSPAQALLTFVAYLDRPAAAMRVVGLFDAAGPDDPYWFGDTRALEPVIEDTETQRLVFAYGLVPTSLYPSLLEGTGAMPFTARWRYQVEARRLRPGQVSRLASELRGLELRYGVVPEQGSAEPEARTGLARVLERYRRERLLATTTLAFAGAGLLALALIALAATALAGGDRHRAALSLAGDRGGSRGTVVGSAVAGALVVALPAALAGGALAAAVSGRVDPLSLALVAGVAGAAALAVAAALVSRRGGTERSGKSGRRRATLELLLVATAAGGVVFARTRGGQAGTVDPYLLAAPVLVVTAAWAAMLRVLPAATHALAGAGGRRRGLVVVLALRRLAGRPRSSAVLLGVALVTAAVATFASLAAGGGEVASPLREGASTALRLAAGLGVGYGTLAVGLAVAVAVRIRVGEEQDLAAVGVSSRQRLAIGTAEFVPVALVGVIAGVAAGGLSYLAVRPALPLGAVGGLGPEVALAAVAVPAAAALAVLVVSRLDEDGRA